MTRRIASLIVIAFGFFAGAGATDPMPLARRVADWQFAHIGAAASHTNPETYDPRGWVMGAFDIGLTALADRDPAYAKAVFRVGEEQDWQLGSRPFHADDHAVGQTWIWAFERNRDPKMIAAVKARFDTVVAANPNNSLDYADGKPGMEAGCQDRWCWCDALFMGPPGWFELSRATGDPRYAAYADKEYRATVARLFDPIEHLFYRDTRFLDRKGPHGEKIFWARGNGWVYAGLARILSFLPPDAPQRSFYVDLFRRMSARIVGLQKPDGYWPVSLLGPGENTPPETSGTGFFTFGLAYGVAGGLLTEPKYREAALKGWAALQTAVAPDGNLGWVQPIGAAPDAVEKDDTAPFGVGAFLLAATAIADMHQPATKLTLHNPLTRARIAARINIPAALLPRPMAGEWVAEAGGISAPLQTVANGAVTVLDLPAGRMVRLRLRPRLVFDSPLNGLTRATIPVKNGDHYTEATSFKVPPTHIIHDPLLPIEGAGWESDRIGYRVYLDKRFVTDIYGKKLPGPILDKIGQGGPSYHEDAGWGLDIWHVGDSLGAGGLGVLRNGMATQIGDMKSMRADVVARGPEEAEILVSCEGWNYAGKPADLVASFSITAGSRVSMMSAKAKGVPLVAGFAHHANTVFIASPRGAKGWKYIATWGRQSDDGKDDVGVALFYPPAEIARTGDDGRSSYIVFKNPARARYGFGTAWVREGRALADEASFRVWLDVTAEELGHPVTVTK